LAVVTCSTPQNDFLNVWVAFEVIRMLLDYELGTMRLDEKGLWIDPGDFGPEHLAAASQKEMTPVKPEMESWFHRQPWKRHGRMNLGPRNRPLSPGMAHPSTGASASENSQQETDMKQPPKSPLKILAWLLPLLAVAAGIWWKASHRSSSDQTSVP